MDEISSIDDATMDQIVSDLKSDEPYCNLRGIQMVRRILCKSRNPPADQLIANEIVPLCVQLLDSPLSDILIESAWVLTNIASGPSTQTMAIVETDAVPKLIHLLRSADISIADHSAWALSNIASDASDIILDCNGAEAILSLLVREQPIFFLRNLVWLLSNLCRSTNFARLPLVLSALSHLLQSGDVHILICSAWAIKKVSSRGLHGIDAIIIAGCVPGLIQLLTNDKMEVITSVLEAIRYFVAGTATQIQNILDAGLLQQLIVSLHDSRPLVVHKSLCILAEILRGSAHQIQQVIDARIFEQMPNVMMDCAPQTRDVAIRAIANVAYEGTTEQIMYLHRCGILQIFNEDENVSNGQPPFEYAYHRFLQVIEWENVNGAVNIFEKFNQMQLN